MLHAPLVLKSAHNQQSLIRISENCVIGGKEIVMIAGPCAVENAEQMQTVAQRLSACSVQAIRGGVFKPRTSPYAFQGMAEEGIAILSSIEREFGLPTVTEVMSSEQLTLISPHVAMLQVGSRNMQNFELLKQLGKTNKPILLKRGLAATIEELIMAAEYICAHGNNQVVLCERGIRSFDPHTRNVLDLGAVVALKQMTHLPVIVDPSHAAGKRELVADLARAAIACGADGLIIECHPEPEKSVSDARQALSLEDMEQLMASLAAVARAVGRTMTEAATTSIAASAPIIRELVCHS
jgi:3-deoxy-7-phosphoheptulonate synthase